MARQTHQPVQLELEALGLTPAALRQVIQEYSETTGVRITFKEGSNPQFHLHFHGEVMAKKDEIGTQYTDQSTGPTGAKAFGPASSATSHGAVIQNQALGEAQAGELVKAFEQLAAVLRDLQIADRAKLDETLEAITQAKTSASSPEPKKNLISSAWEKAKGWVSAALSVGTFAATKAEEVKSLIAKITGLLS